jgi:arylsulfatase A-like enzyme
MVSPRPPHRPYHCPPDGLYDDSNGPCDESWTYPQQFRAAVEAVDFELDRLLVSMTDEQRRTTTIILLGDNGTYIDSIDSTSAIDTTTDRFKTTPYELGVRVPLIVAGPLVTDPGFSDALVQTTDIFATVAALAAIPLDATELSAVDSMNLLPMVHHPGSAGERLVAYSELVGPVQEPPVIPDGGGHSARNATYRLVHRSGEEYELYDLSVDLWETDGADLISNAGGEPADLDVSDPSAAAAFCELKEALEPDDCYVPLPGSSGNYPMACP